MKKSTFLLFILSIIFVALLSFYIFRNGHYPVALVHGEWISARQFNREHTVYGQVFEEYARTNRLVVSTSDAFIREVGRNGFNRLIEATLIQRSIQGLPGRAAEKEIKRQVRADQKNPNNAQLRETIGNIDEKEFVKVLLQPRAEREFLKNYLAEQGKDFDEWLLEARRRARVAIFKDPYEWDGEKVILDDGK
jgi:hypothetical protein